MPGRFRSQSTSDRSDRACRNSRHTSGKTDRDFPMEPRLCSEMFCAHPYDRIHLVGFDEVGVRIPCADDRSNKNIDRKSTRLNSSHTVISYAVFCLKKKKMY